MTTARPLRRPVWLFQAYMAVFAALGCAVLAWAVVGQLPSALPTVDARFLLLGALVVVAELRPISIRRRGITDSVSLSGAFACALLLGYDWSLVMVVQALASVVDDARDRTVWLKSAFNVGQYTLSLGAASLLLAALPGTAGQDVPLLGAVAACLVFFALNTLLTGIAFALHDGDCLLPALRADVPFQASVNGVVVAMAPLVLAVAEKSLWLVALVIVPVVAVHRGALSSLERDHLSLHDPVTELPNQVAFRERLVEQLAETEDADHHLGVLVLTLDHFDDVNHTLGHAAGAQLLRQVADRLRRAVPGDAVVARLGASSFAISLPALETPWEASTLGEALLRQVADPYAFAESAFALRVSIGVTVSPLHGREADSLMQHAEVASDLARRSRTGLEIYSAERNAFTERRLVVLKGLGPALRRREMAVHFQPQVDLPTGRTCGYEALLRWEHPVLGNVPPDEFVALAEHAGMMREITDYVLDEALRRAAEWRRLGSTATVSVNVSASVLQDLELPSRVARRLAVWGVPSSALVLELTETAVMADPARCQQVMRELRALHVGLSLDDYGTGYASLAYLTTLPVDELKIDKSFVLGMEDSTTSRVVVRSTLELARSLGLRVVAEGVETAAAAALLASYGCHTGQGYLYGKARPAVEIVLPSADALVPQPRDEQADVVVLPD